MTVGICTLGCKVNMYESEFVIELLKKAGYTILSFQDVCDIYIINTCTVTNTSDGKSRKMIRSARTRNPHACVVAMGCFVEAKKQALKDMGIDILLGNKDKSKIVSLLDTFFQIRKPIEHLYPSLDFPFEDMYLEHFEGRTRAFVKIQDGCENFCSYCIIPFVRGKCRSKPFPLVVKEVKALLRHGYKEIVLTGIHTGNYGVDLQTSFATLLKELVTLEGLERLRISSIEITELTPSVLEVLKDSSVIVDHLHIPLQSGSDAILKAMNRKYDLAYFYQVIAAIREIRPNISITTDVIVGFPGETHEMFLETIDTIKKLSFSKLHVFPYSIRNGTVASCMEEQIPFAVKKQRARELILLSKELEHQYQKQFLGSELVVLVETVKDGYSYGHTGNYLYVKIRGEMPLHEMVSVLFTSIEDGVCVAEVIEGVSVF